MHHPLIRWRILLRLLQHLTYQAAATKLLFVSNPEASPREEVPRCTAAQLESGPAFRGSRPPGS